MSEDDRVRSARLSNRDVVELASNAEPSSPVQHVVEAPATLHSRSQIHGQNSSTTLEEDIDYLSYSLARIHIAEITFLQFVLNLEDDSFAEQDLWDLFLEERSLEPMNPSASLSGLTSIIGDLIQLSVDTAARNNPAGMNAPPHPRIRQLMEEYAGLRGTIARLDAALGPLGHAWSPASQTPMATAAVAPSVSTSVAITRANRNRTRRVHPRMLGIGNSLSRINSPEVVGGTFERFTKAYTAEYKLICSEHDYAIAQLTSAIRLVDVSYDANNRHHISTLVRVLKKYEKCYTMLCERREYLEFIKIDDVEAWLEEETKKVEASLRQVKRELRLLGF